MSPKIKNLWANMKIWHEETTGKFTDRGETIFAKNDKELYAKIEWGDEMQIMGALHSNGACLIRVEGECDYPPSYHLRPSRCFESGAFSTCFCLCESHWPTFRLPSLMQEPTISWGIGEYPPHFLRPHFSSMHLGLKTRCKNLV